MLPISHCKSSAYFFLMKLSNRGRQLSTWEQLHSGIHLKWAVSDTQRCITWARRIWRVLVSRRPALKQSGEQKAQRNIMSRNLWSTCEAHLMNISVAGFGSWQLMMETPMLVWKRSRLWACFTADRRLYISERSWYHSQPSCIISWSTDL